MMRLSNTVFDYVPFPIGVLSDALPAEKYNQLVDSFPKKELFKYIESLLAKFRPAAKCVAIVLLPYSIVVERFHVK